MSVLLLRLQSPMQSWGTQSRFGNRDTGLEPSKSGVVGLLAAALGMPRHADAVQRDGQMVRLAELAGLAMAVRVDHEGRVGRDYQTAGGYHRRRDDGYGVLKADGSPGDTVISDRFYLADASFLVGLEGPSSLLDLLARTLLNPTWPLFLGRKAFVPDPPVHFPGNRVEEPLHGALTRFPWTFRSLPGDRQPLLPDRLRYVWETSPEQGEPRQDVPLSFAERLFALRHVRVEFRDPRNDATPLRTEEPECTSP